MGAGRVVRMGLAAATLAFAAIGTALGADARWYAASGLVGTLWWLWDFLGDRVVGPLAASFTQLFFEGGSGPYPSGRPAGSEGDEAIRRLERRLERSVSAEADVHAALQLADLYRTLRDDDLRARALIHQMKARYPGNPLLQRYEDSVA